MQLMVKIGKFVSMQQNSATLIYDLNRMKGIARPFKALLTVPSLKIAPSSIHVSLKTIENCYTPP